MQNTIDIFHKQKIYAMHLLLYKKVIPSDISNFSIVIMISSCHFEHQYTLCASLHKSNGVYLVLIPFFTCFELMAYIDSFYLYTYHCSIFAFPLKYVSLAHLCRGSNSPHCHALTIWLIRRQCNATWEKYTGILLRCLSQTLSRQASI